MSPDSPDHTRRAALGSIAAAGVVGLAGCSSSLGGSPDPTDSGNGTPSNTTTDDGTTEASLSQTELVDDFEDLSKWSVQSGALHPDKDVTFAGSQSARLDHGRNPVRLTRSVDMDLTKRDLSLAFRMESSGNAVPQIILYAPDSENALLLGEGVRQEANGAWIRLDVGARNVNGLPDLSNVQHIEIRVRGGGPETKFWVDDLRSVPSPESGKALLFFDDGRTSAYSEAYPVLKEYDMPATVPVITGQVGDQGRASLDQLKELQSAGWEMCSHTSSHTSLHDISRLTAEQEIANAKQWLVDNGFETGSRWLAYPYGGWNEAVANFAQKHHDLAFRYMGSRSIGSSQVTQPMTVSRGDASDLELAKRMVDLGDLYNDLEMFAFHDVGSKGKMTTSRAEFEEFAAYLEDSSLDVVTPSTVYSDLRAPVEGDA